MVRRFSDAGVAALVVTEIGRDGTLEGPDAEGLAEVLGTAEVPVIASGGVGTLGDLRTLAALEVRGRRLSGAIVGRAIYDGAFEVSDALVACVPPAAGGA
jgi:phosphoribosylformimino-5-aminoimidazole carboxamide ribotide isomerase